jgi:hypothetical protein
VSDPTAVPKKVPVWERRRGLVIGVAVAAIILITVLSDLPVSTSRASDIGAERSVMTEVNTDLAGCAYAINQALGIWNLEATHQLTSAQRAPTPGLLSDDQSACAFTNEDIFDLSNVQVPQTTAGKQLGQMVASATLWTTSDALRVIEDVQKLMNDPKNQAALRDLSTAESQLSKDRGSALEHQKAADRALDTHLPPVDLPVAVRSSSG